MSDVPTVMPDELLWVDVGSLKHFPGNAKNGDVDGIAASIAENGFFRPLMVQKSTRHVVYGNSTLRAVKKLHFDRVQILLCDIDDDRAKTINLAENRYGERGEWNVPALITQLDAMPKLSGTGFELKDLDALKLATGPASMPSGGGNNDGGGDLVHVQIGPLGFDVDPDEFQSWLDELSAGVGKKIAAQVLEVRQRLGLDA